MHIFVCLTILSVNKINKNIYSSSYLREIPRISQAFGTILAALAMIWMVSWSFLRKNPINAADEEGSPTTTTPLRPLMCLGSILNHHHTPTGFFTEIWTWAPNNYKASVVFICCGREEEEEG
jgi:hypothetical protein